MTSSPNLYPANDDETQLVGFVPPMQRNLAPLPANDDETQLVGFVPPAQQNLAPLPANDDETQLVGFVPPAQQNLTAAPANVGYKSSSKQSSATNLPDREQPTHQKEEEECAAALVGWLVVTAGRHRGTAIELHDGDNVITYSDTRGLQHATTIAEGCVLVLNYSPDGYFAAIPAKPNTRPNWGIELKAEATLRLKSGVTLRFIPLCNGNFCWK